MNKKWSVFRFKHTNKHTEQRLDLILANEIADLSRSKAKKIIDIGGVHINGRRSRSCSASLHDGDLIEVYLDHLPLDPFRLTEKHIVFQDKYLIVIDKPALVDTQPTHARFKGTLYEALRWYLQTPFNVHQKCDIGMVQRLDRGTSGLITFSLHPQSHKGMTQAFVQHSINKQYLALVSGCPENESGEIRSLLARSRQSNKVKSVAKGGKEAITQYRVVEKFNNYSLVSIAILTGRSHQIRVHMSEHGCPLLGDTLYGGLNQLAGFVFDRPLLHACELSFTHPVSRVRLSFESVLPADMQSTLNWLRESQL